MISRASKKVADPDSDSDWDSLPGDISHATEPSSSPDYKHALKPSGHSPNPPKQPNNTHTSAGKHHAHTTSKPLNMYNKNPMNNSQKSVTTFEDRGLWHDDEDEDNNNRSGVRSPNPKGHGSSQSSSGNVSGEKKKAKQSIQDPGKRPPFTDFKEALKSPIPPTDKAEVGHELSSANQAYRMDTGDGTAYPNMSHDSWDESDGSEQEPKAKVGHKPEYGIDKSVAVINRHAKDPEPRHLKAMKAAGVHEDRSPFSDVGLQQLHGGQHLDVNDNNLRFENCCLVQVSHGPYDDRYRPSFFHGSKNHFHVREDDPRPAISDIADKSEAIFQRFWREVFGVLQIVINFFSIFVLEFLKVVVYSLRYFISGVLYTIGDHLTKPLLAAFFNNIIQPFSILLLNLFAITRNLLKPFLELTREFFSQISIPLRAFRLFELNWKTNHSDDSFNTDIKVV